MPRRPRIVLPGTPLHLLQRGNNREACFYADEDYLFYLEWLNEYAEKCHRSIHAYVLITPHKTDSAGALMKDLALISFLSKTTLKSNHNNHAIAI